MLPEVQMVKLSPSRTWTGTRSSQRPPCTFVTTTFSCRSSTETRLGYKAARCQPALLLKKMVLWRKLSRHTRLIKPSQTVQIKSIRSNNKMSTRGGCQWQRGGVVIYINIQRSCEFLQPPWANFLQITTLAHFHSTGLAHDGFLVRCLQMLSKASSLSQKSIHKLRKQHQLLAP